MSDSSEKSAAFHLPKLKCHVELVEVKGSDRSPKLRPRVLRVNGVEVGLVESFCLEDGYNNDDGCKVHLTLLPDHFEIKSE